MSRQRAIQQLELPSSVTQAAALAEEVARLEGYLQAAHEELAALKGEITALHGQLAAEREYIHVLQVHVASLESGLRFGTDFTSRGWHPQSSALPAWLDTALKALIREAHPDKWVQGQPASELAHALTVDLNALRAKLGEVVS